MPARKKIDPRYGTARWKKLRLLILARDGYECQIKGERCTKVAKPVDHVIPVAAGGDFWSPSNLRSACVWCNAHKGQTADIVAAALNDAGIEMPPTSGYRPSRDWWGSSEQW